MTKFIFLHLGLLWRCLGLLYTDVIMGCQEALHTFIDEKISDKDSIDFFADINKCILPKYVDQYAYRPIPHSVFHEVESLNENGIDANNIED